MVDDNNLAEECAQPTVAIGFIIFFNNGVLDNNETVGANNASDPSGEDYGYNTFNVFKH